MKKLPGFSAAAALGGANQHYRAQYHQARTSAGAKPAVVLPDRLEAFGFLGNALPEGTTAEGMAAVNETGVGPEALEVLIDYSDDGMPSPGETDVEEETLITGFEENGEPTAITEEADEVGLAEENGEFIQETTSQ